MDKWETLKEPQLKEALVPRLEKDFRIVLGDDPNSPKCYHYHTGANLRPDLLCFPRQHLRDTGWPDWVFFIEIKDCIGGTGASRCNEVAWQAEQYTHCVCNFRLPGFVLIFLPFEKLCPENPQYASGIAGLMQRKRVGELFVRETGEYKIKFASSVFYDSSDGRQNFLLLARNHWGNCQ